MHLSFTSDPEIDLMGGCKNKNIILIYTDQPEGIIMYLQSGISYSDLACPVMWYMILSYICIVIDSEIVHYNYNLGLLMVTVANCC